jgi:transposase
LNGQSHAQNHTAHSIYTGHKQPLSFEKLRREMLDSRLCEKQRQVLIGEKQLLPVRLILRLVPDEVYEKRIRAKEKENRKKGGKISDETKIRLRFNLYITNAAEEALPASDVFSLYRLRWQVELMFKIWKSVFKIDKLQKMKQARYLSLLYAKLLLIVIHLQMTFRIQQALCRKQQAEKMQILSLNKSLKTLSSLFDRLLEMLRSNHRKAMIVTRDIVDRISKNHWLEKKKNKLSFPEIIQLFICQPEK